MDLYEEAIATKEREHFPLVGPSVDRRSIQLLTQSYNDAEIMNLVCFVCGQSKTKTPGQHSEIERQTAGWLAKRGRETLEANLGWVRWFQKHGAKEPLVTHGPGQCQAHPQSEWCCKLREPDIELFGNPEDWACARCTAKEHKSDSRGIELCNDCTLPVCTSCKYRLASAGEKSNGISQ